MPDPTVQPDATCEWLLDDPEDDECPVVECGEPSRYVVERDDGDPSYSPAESCPLHLGDVVPWLIDGCENVRAVVTVRWDAAMRQCRHCGGDIIPCRSTCASVRDYPLCKGWRHYGYDSQPVIGHCCGGRMINPPAEPREDEDRA